MAAVAERSARNARIASVVAATGISLACGTNYAFSAWGPDFARKLELTATQSNIIGAAGNVGAYAMGVPAGLLIDSRGTRIAVIFGAISLACGYFPIHTAYEKGPGYMSVGMISFCSFLTGAGSCTAFSASIKTSAYNWPQHRGTATAFPLSGFGLSAFFFTTIGHIFLGESTSDFILLLAIGTLVLNVASFFFLRLIPANPTIYQPVSGDERPIFSSVIESTKLRKRTSSLVDPDEFDSTSPSTPTKDTVISISEIHNHHQPSLRSPTPIDAATAPNINPEDADERTSILSSRASTVSEYGREDFNAKNHLPAVPAPEITGTTLLKQFEFWQLFGMLGLLSGVGLMTINNIGNDTGALWRNFDPKTSLAFIKSRYKIQVGLLSLMSCAGRITSGIGSDILIKRLHASRFWCLFFSACVFTLAQLFALTISNPNYLWFLSALTGIGYGALFGVFPALTADAFGVNGLSLNWGFMIFAPTITGNVYNVLYGRILDANSPHGTEGNGECMKGLNCYVSAYWITLASSLLGAVGALWCIRYEGMKKARRLTHGREA